MRTDSVPDHMRFWGSYFAMAPEQVNKNIT